ncbi:hypothetical protein A8C32_14725 [Flavivirga aquatica]|uniref:Uncharacterized protein n=1 Tax=Flavivirga aquatica TaxID=1849968 RepID=A0A1E5T9U4_9FLAO|nr:hypothetical protein [Flavivirga aquatica]OEK08087.1 hypothetical protein A8C32_14725 [Flavivirga aquatica]
MQELNKELGRILDQFKDENIDLQIAIEKFNCLFSKFKEQTDSNEYLINSLEFEFSKILKKLSHIKGVNSRLENRKETNVELRRELGLI